MGRGGARLAVGGALIVLVLAVALSGCGAETHANEPRPEGPTRISLTISPGGVTITPAKVGDGPEEGQQVPQNEGQPQPEIKGSKEPLDIVFVAANVTAEDATIKIDGPRQATSTTIGANSPGTFQTQLPAGSYTITATGTDAAPAHLEVGTYRASSQNDLLEP